MSEEEPLSLEQQQAIIEQVEAKLLKAKKDAAPKTRRCRGLPMFRYTWPGREEEYTCLEHAMILAKTAGAMGFRLQIIPLNNRYEQHLHRCSQRVGLDEREGSGESGREGAGEKD